MAKSAFQLLLAAYLAAGTLWAANDPFAGKWKLNPSKSKLTDDVITTFYGSVVMLRSDVALLFQRVF